jgi:hypothetical protein
MSEGFPIVVLLKWLIAGAGVYITWQAGRAARRRHHHALWVLSGGILFLTAGAVSVGGLESALGVGPGQGAVVSHSLIVSGFFAIVYSLQVDMV